MAKSSRNHSQNTDILTGPFAFLWRRKYKGLEIREDLGVRGHYPRVATPYGLRLSFECLQDPVPAGAALAVPSHEHGEPYMPLEHASLYREFAELETRHQILSFCTRFGFLGRYVYGLSSDPARGSDFAGEHFTVWNEQIAKLKQLVRLFDALRKPKYSDEAVERLIDLGGRGKGPEFRDKEPGGVQVRDFYVPGYTLPMRTVSTLTIREAGELVLLDQVNKELALGTYPATTMLEGSAVYVVPRDLLGALYLLFAREAMGGLRAPKFCDGCGKWFIPEGSMKQTYCSDSCKYRAYRKRKKDKSKTEDQSNG